MNIVEFLTWMAVSGGNAMVASFILEKLAWFQNLQAEAKKWTFFGTAAVLGVASLAGLTYIPMEIIEAITPYFLVVYGTFVSVMLGEGFHKVVNKK